MFIRCLLIVSLTAGYCLTLPTGEKDKAVKPDNEPFPKEIVDFPAAGYSLIVLDERGASFVISKAHKVSHSKASEICKSYGMALIKVDTKAKVEVLKKIIEHYTTTKNGPFWMSGYRLNDGRSWRFEDGELIRITNWDKGEPNNAKGDELCIELYQREGVWDDQRCSERIDFICEGKLTVDTAKLDTNAISENDKVDKSGKSSVYSDKADVKA